MNALDRAIAMFPSQAAFARAIGVASPSVSDWRKSGAIPAWRCYEIEKVTQGQVLRSELDPILFGPIPEIETTPLPVRG